MPAPKGHPPWCKPGQGGAKQKYTDEFIEAEAEAFLEWIKHPENIYHKKFALERGYSAQRFNEWEKVNNKFSEAMQIIREWQETKLFENGLLSKFNSGITKFGLINNHGWSDRTESKVIHQGFDLSGLQAALNKSKDLVSDSEPGNS